MNDAVKNLAALAHEGRLTLFRHLIEAGSNGVGAGELADYAQVGATTASAQLAVLGHAGLIQSKRKGRQVIYTANFNAMLKLLNFLLHNCCAGNPAICHALLSSDLLSSSLQSSEQLSNPNRASAEHGGKQHNGGNQDEGANK